LKIRYSITLISLILLTPISRGQIFETSVCADSVSSYQVNSTMEGSRYYWFIHPEAAGEIVRGEFSSHISIRWNYATRNRVTIQVYEESTHGCQGTMQNAELDIIAPYVDLGDDFPEICFGDSLLLSPGIQFAPPYSITWSDGSTGNQYTAKQTGTIWVKVVDGTGCGRFDTVSLLVHPLPEPNLPNDMRLCDPSQPVILDPGDYAFYDWNSSLAGRMGTGSSLDIYPTTLIDTITVEVSDYNNCRTTDTLLLLPCDLEEFFRDLTNTITPNGDGENDVWNLNIEPYNRLLGDAVLEIFDRWGRLVYRTESVLEEPWDGTSKGKPLPMDSYYYVLKINLEKAPPIAGTVNLIR